MKRFIILGCIAGTLMLTACRGGIVSSGVNRAEAKINPTTGNVVTGSVVFSEAGKKLRVVAEIAGLAPGPHGFHIHEKGDCSASDGSSAGGHFNPSGKLHGNPDHAEHHAGDMPQLIADAKGVARLVAYIDELQIGDGEEEGDIVGRSIIVHASPDDFKTQPTGNSGARLACGVIIKK